MAHLNLAVLGWKQAVPGSVWAQFGIICVIFMSSAALHKELYSTQSFILEVKQTDDVFAVIVM